MISNIHNLTGNAPRSGGLLHWQGELENVRPKADSQPLDVWYIHGI